MSSQTTSHLSDPAGAVSEALGTDRLLWADAFDTDPRYAKQVVTFTATVTSCRALSDKDRDLILFGAAAAATAADRTMMRAHAARALRSGATVRELDEVLLAVAVLGGHAHSIAMTTLLELEPQAPFEQEVERVDAHRNVRHLEALVRILRHQGQSAQSVVTMVPFGLIQTSDYSDLRR